MKGKKIIAFVFFLIIAYVIWLGWNLLLFKKYRSTSSPLSLSAPSSPEENAIPTRPFDYEIEGVYHIHTRYSDGWRSASKIAKIASRSSLDFIILTDHGNPNPNALASAGWKDGVLVLAGAELSVSRGHLVGLGFAPPARNFSQNTEIAVREIGSQGGFSIIAHPYSKTRWSWGEFIAYAGLELMDADTALKRDFFLSLPYFPALVIRPGYSFLKMLDDPAQSFRKWDELNHLHPVYGYYSADAHILYGSVFSLFHLHLLLSKPLAPEFESARQQVFDALRRGNFYNSIEAAAEARGFRFWGEKSGKIFPMGSILPFDPAFPVTLQALVPFSFANEIQFRHNGKMIQRTQENTFLFKVQEPGVYRIEVYLREKSPLGENIPWIVSNPIFLRKEKE